MNKVSFEEIGAMTATFYAESSVVAQRPVKMTGDGTVGACSEGDRFCGVALSNEKGFAGVQVRGFIMLPYTGTLTVGFCHLAANGTGGVTGNANGGSYLVVSVDAAAGTAVICL